MDDPRPIQPAELEFFDKGRGKGKRFISQNIYKYMHINFSEYLKHVQNLPCADC